jgi:hypothetical protein
MTSENLSESESAMKAASQGFFNMITLLSSSSSVSLLVGGAALMVAVISYLAFAGSTPATSSRKAQQARVMRKAYRTMERQALSSDSKRVRVGSSLRDRRIRKLS